MISSGSVWKRASAVLAVLCAALVVANFLLYRRENQPVDPIEEKDLASAFSPTQEVGGPEQIGGLKPAATRSDFPAPSRISAESKNPSALPGGDVDPPRQPAAAAAPVNDHRPPAPIERRRSNSGPVEIPKSHVTDRIRPLGIVERADGRTQAVIEDGEWVQVVEVGQVLAENSRVVKISAEGVEIERVAKGTGIEMAQAAERKSSPLPHEVARLDEDAAAGRGEVVLRWNEGPVHGAATPSGSAVESARQGTTGIPGMEMGQAAYKVAKPAGWEARPVPTQGMPAAVDGRDEELRPKEPAAESGSYSKLPHEGTLGVVTHADGRVQMVVADGPWVKLVPKTSDSVNDGPSLEQGQTVPEPIGAPRLQRNGKSGEERLESQSGESDRALQDIVEPIGLVEWPSGRVQAVLAQGDSVQLVEDPGLVADARRILALASPPEIPRGELAVRVVEPPARATEDEVAALRSLEGEEHVRAPPEIRRGPAREPEEAARGQPKITSSEWSRPPPVRRAREDDFWQADLPGIEETAAANITQLVAAGQLTSPILSEPEDAKGGRVSSAGQERIDGTQWKAPLPPSHAPNEQTTGFQAAPRIELLGFVQWPGGRAQAIIAVGGSTVLVEKGQTLANGTRVVDVGPDGVVLEPANAQPGGTKIEPGGHAEGQVWHLNSHEVAGSVLQSERPLRNNRSQPRE